MIRPLPAALLALVAALLSACGIQAQHRPEVVSVFPADGQVVPIFLGCIRVTYDEPVTVLNDTAVRIRADALGNDGDVAARVFPDPTDDHSILVRPAAGGNFFPGYQHHLVIQEGAVVNAGDHYKLQEFGSYFTVGPAPTLFLTSDDGSVYEVAPATGAPISSTPPPPGYRARDPLGTEARLWVWLDPVVPGSSLLATFLPGAPGMTVVPLSGEVGTRHGSGLALSADAHVLYAVADDASTGVTRVHRIDVDAVAELPSPLALATTLAPGARSHRPAYDPQHLRLYVAQGDGAGGGWLSSIDTQTFTQLDLVPGAGIDPVALPSGAGPLSYDTGGDNGRLFVLLVDAPSPGFTLLNPFGFSQDTAFEPQYPGSPSAGVPTPDGRYFVQGLVGYTQTFGLVRSETSDLGQGFLVDVIDDIGTVPQGSDRVGALLVDPASTHLFAFADDGVKSVLCLYELVDEDVQQIDLDPVTPGLQAIDLSGSVGGVVTGATTLYGAVPP